MSSDESYLPEFFTPERLEWYRDLSARFPLWCGNWPQELLNLPEATAWSPDQIIWSELDKCGVDFIEYWFEPTPGVGVMPRPVLVWEEPNPDFDPEEPYFLKFAVSTLEPPIYSAWFAALNYVGHDWSDEGPKPRATARVLGDAEHHLKALRSILTRHAMKRPNQHELNRRIREVLNTKPGSDERKSAIEAAEDYWITVGREAGELPFVRARTVHLPGDFLFRLHAEADEFTEQLRDWTADDLEEAHSLLDVSSEADTGQDLYLEELATRHPELAETRRQDRIRIIKREESDVPLWSRVLRFPFLTLAELPVVLNSPRGRGTAATNLLWRRLPQIARSTLQSRLPTT